MIKYYLIIENTENPIKIELKTLPHTDGYIIFWKNNIRNNIPKSLYNKLVKNGLYSKPSVGMIEQDRITALHRLIACLYSNIQGLDIHHIFKDVRQNSICSLVPVEKSLHIKLDRDEINGIQESLDIQTKWKNSIFRRHRNTLAQNVELIYLVMSMLSDGFNVNEIVKRINRKIKSSKIYELKRLYYHWQDFVKWLESDMDIETQEFNGNFLGRWEKVLKFEAVEPQQIQLFAPNG